MTYKINIKLGGLVINLILYKNHKNAEESAIF